MEASQGVTWRRDCTLSVAEAIREATRSPRPSVETPQDLPSPPMPHLPLRKASTEKLKSKRARPPKPLWTPADHALRGFSPSPVHALPQVDTAPASSEHAFASKEESRMRPYKPPLAELTAISYTHDIQMQASAESAEWQPGDDAGLTGPPSSPLLPTPPESPRIKTKSKGLKASKSVGDGIIGLRSRFSSPNEARAGMTPPLLSSEYRSSVPMPLVPAIPTEAEIRDSFKSAVASTRSAVTTDSSARHTSVQTEHSSVTAASSHTSDFVHVYPNWPATTPDAYTDDEMTVEEAIGMYEAGFDTSARPSMDTEVRRSFMTMKPAQDDELLQENVRPSTGRSDEQNLKPRRPQHAHRRSQSASLLDHIKSEDRYVVLRQRNSKHTFSRILSAPITQNGMLSVRHSTDGPDVPRDRYGFKKASLHVTVQQYDAWNLHYTEHLERRSKKWHALMQSYGLTTDQPIRFPPKSDKIKRYVRKGIPPEFRGAAWFWYAGGPSKLAKQPGLYQQMLQRAIDGDLSDSDKEHIERDLHRTFPDNIRFKPDPVPASEMPETADINVDDGAATKKRKKARHSMEPPETPITQALRCVLQAFAVQNPHIGYCQSLNFIAGLLLLFLDQDEEKAFILLNIVTTTHLPGTHGVALEGANIDIAVLMSCVKDCLPAIWSKFDDNGGAHMASSLLPGAQALRLPTVSLATTAWFMSIFVGTLPIECVLRIWDCLFFEGSKTLFQVALAIFKFGEKNILAVNDPMEVFQVVQTVPRSMLDINALLEVSFRRRGGFGHVSQALIEARREERRKEVREGVASIREGRMSVWKKVRTRVA